MGQPAAELLASVIVVNYNGCHYLEDCLAALERQTLPRHQFEVLLIDNGSRDHSLAFVRERFPWVRVVALKINTGFTGANNLGFERARGRYFVMLNNDTRAHPDWLETLIGAAQGNQVGGATSTLVFRDDPTRLNSTGLVLLRDGRAGDRGLGLPLDSLARERREEVLGGCGANLLLDRLMLADVGGLDDRLFMYYEDLDLAWRARLRGWRFVFEPRAIVEHVGGGSSAKQSPFLLRQIERNRALVNLRNAPPFLAIWAFVGLMLRVFRCLGRSMHGRGSPPTSPAHVRGMIQALGSVIWHLPEILMERYDVRVARRRVSDRVIERFVSARL